MQQITIQPLLYFDGKTYDPSLDQDRLTKQLGRVYETLSSGDWWSLEDIKYRHRFIYHKHDSEAGISARIRDLRKQRFGGYTIETKRNDAGLWQYRIRMV